MKKKIMYLALCIVVISIKLHAQSIIVHDPVMIQETDTYYLFCTGPGISAWTSSDMKNWKQNAPVFEESPVWAKETVAEFNGHIWAPDIAYYNNQYYLYYSISSFGKNNSCIGLATNKTLNPEDPEFKWVDHGIVIQSFPGETYWNAIDPNLIISEDGTPYLSYGSFWGGLKMVQLTKDAQKVVGDKDDILTIASRNTKENAIEAPFIFKKDNYYYLFASIDFCCRGKDSTYKMIVGRSNKIQGPFLDKNGIDLANGGGSILLKGNEKWHGVGHNSAYTFNNTDYLVFHGYDANDQGKPKLIIKQIQWDDNGWPVVNND
ncbi:family 43 glycosylhydrolase [Plebeiibacterium marinum]|uniref:Family 43 glycosylhydrolase n=1 Tax=Plebeiibacterium marinum TaxID=2992111 RepID=A0AAE3MD17_9BACT|nr:family 43 glycosylhydrolase [Plebeiobacterium marinum]MCW3805332.1 family 43 glycosylhydrolase [Plebeiobacterium marinum]